MTKKQPVLELKGVGRSFGGLVAVNSVDLEVAAGSITSIIGPNGAGKTTLFNVISGIYAPTKGNISLSGALLATPDHKTEREAIIWGALSVEYRRRRTGARTKMVALRRQAGLPQLKRSLLPQQDRQVRRWQALQSLRVRFQQHSSRPK